MADDRERAEIPESGGAEGAPAQRVPRRYKLYDRIKDHVSLRTIDTVIILTALAIVVLLVVGIVTGNKG